MMAAPLKPLILSAVHSKEHPVSPRVFGLSLCVVWLSAAAPAAVAQPAQLIVDVSTLDAAGLGKYAVADPGLGPELLLVYVPPGVTIKGVVETASTPQGPWTSEQGEIDEPADSFPVTYIFSAERGYARLDATSYRADACARDCGVTLTAIAGSLWPQ
jgi:hypothetical protein